MQAQIKLGRIFGIEIGLHYSWLIIALLITLSLSAHFESINPEWGSTLVWLCAVGTSVLFFVSIVAHELSHSLVAKSRGMTVRSITLFALGGVSQTENDAPDSKTEFWMAIAGPLASLVIGALCLALAAALGWKAFITPKSPAAATLVWLGYINCMLAGFNMIPGFPLDGGRVFRAIIWWYTGDQKRSTVIAAQIGQTVGYIFIVIGVMRFFGGAGLGGLWICFIGWFLLEAARSSQVQSVLVERLHGFVVRNVMSREDVNIDGRTNIQTFVHEHLGSGQRCFIVNEYGRPAGLVTPKEIRAVPHARWPYTTLDEIMRPMESLRTISADAPVITALQIMAREDLNQLPVVVDGRVEGLISRSHVLQLLQTQAELYGDQSGSMNER